LNLDLAAGQHFVVTLLHQEAPMNRHVPKQTMSSREFNQNTGKAKQAADHGPLVITDRGEPAYVLMRYEDFDKLVPVSEHAARKMTLAEALHDPRPEADVDFEFPRLDWRMREIDFEV
jgi:prevent-host-death family protein